jgi:cyanobactin maturation PatA/PatG family protease
VGFSLVKIQPALAGLRQLPDAPLGAREVCVAVLDGPVDLSHPCFEGADLERIDTLVNDPAGSGRMSAHGTHVTSVIFGQPGTPVVGVAPGCRGLIAPVFRDGQRERVSQLDLARAIEQVVERGANIINFSGGERSPTPQPEGPLERALRFCDENNVLVVAAVGNDGCACIQVPAAVSSVLAVGAIGKDGLPLDSSNWGNEYAVNGVLAPGEQVFGAVPGGGQTSLTGTSFATALVAGLAALLLSKQLQLGQSLDPKAAREAILATALPCQPRESTDCRRFLAGTVNVPEAYASIVEGAQATVTTHHQDQPLARDAQQSSTVETAITPASESVESAGLSAAGSEQVEPANAARTFVSTVLEPPQPHPAEGTAVRPAAHGAGPSSADCGCNGASKSHIFAIGEVGFDFGTEARRDTFRQLMPDVVIPGDRGAPDTIIRPNPYDVVQLSNYLDGRHSESTRLIWTLNLDLTPIYALEAEGSYAEDVYSVLRGALRNQALPPDDPHYVSRVSIPGILTNQTRRLYSGQELPLVKVEPRGMATWNEPALVDHVFKGLPTRLQQATQQDQQAIRDHIRILLDKVYYELRNLGQMSSDRALNYAATNAVHLANTIAAGLLSGTGIPTEGDRHGLELYSLDTISVTKSPYCRPDSDCWDVQLRFFDPANDRRARGVYMFPIDVSDVIPVNLSKVHQFYTTS